MATQQTEKLIRNYYRDHSVRELSRVRQAGRYWLVEILSAATGRWIIQGEWLTQSAAEQDRKNWM